MCLYRHKNTISGSPGILRRSMPEARARPASNFKVSAGFQIDYHGHALCTGDGNVKNIDRGYSGPFVRLSGAF